MNPMALFLQRGRRRGKANRSTPFYRSAWTACIWLLNAMVLFYAVENWRGARRFAQVKQRLAQRGVSLDWKSYAPPAIPDEENVAMHPLLRPLCEYERIRSPHPKGGWTVTTRWLDSNGLRRLEAVRLPTGWEDDKKFKRIEPNRQPLTDLARWQTCFRHDTNFPSPAQPGAPGQDVLLALARFEPELCELREALSRPGCRFPLHYDDRPNEMLIRHLAALKGLAQVLKLRAAALSAAGEAEKALADVQDIFALAGGLKDEPVMVSFLVRVSIVRIGCNAIGEGLMRRAWSESQLLRLQALLAKQELLAGLGLAIHGETASALQTLEAVRADGGFAMHLCGGEGAGRQFMSLRWAPRGWFDQNKAAIAEHIYQRTMPAFDPAARRVHPAKVNAEVANRNSMRRTPYSLFAILSLPYTDRAIRRAAHAQTVVDETLVACALERHRLATGCFPDSLEELSLEYLALVPRDLVSGAPLRYRLSPNGAFLLWSVGWNEKDDSGVESRTRDGTLNIEEGDWIWERPAL